MNKYLNVLIALMISVSTYSQCYFHELYRSSNNDNYDFAYSVIQTYDNDYIMVGTTEVDNASDAVFAVKTNDCGDTLWQKIYDLSPIGGEIGHSIVEINSNLYAIAVARLDPPQSKREAFLYFINSAGDLLFTKIINVGINEIIAHSKVVISNSIVTGGYLNESTPDSNLFLIKTDLNGDVLWKRQYNIPGSSFRVMKNFDTTQDGGYIIGGSVVLGSGRNLYLIKTDSLGNHEWTKTYPNTLFQGAVIANSEGGYVLVGNEQPNTNNYNGYIGKMDSAGNVIWEKRFSQTGEPSVFTHVIELPDGNYLCLGGSIRTANDYTARVALTKISKTNGDIIWMRPHTYYGGDSDDYGGEVIITQEGDIVATGYVRPFFASSYGNDMFILKTDSCGYLNSTSIDAGFTFAQNGTHGIDFSNQSQDYCTTYWYFGDGSQSNAANPNHIYADTGIYTVTLIVKAGNSTDTIVRQVNVGVPSAISFLSMEGSGVGFYPNPAKDNVTITTQGLAADAYLLYDITGRVILSGAIESNSQAVDVGVLSKGVYLISVSDKGKVVGNGKVVKE